MHRSTRLNVVRWAAGICLALGSQTAPLRAADWSDTALSWRYGTTFAEPFNSEDISKHILALSHASGYQYGTNFFNIDLLISDDKDPSYAGSNEGAQEVYVVYRHSFDLGKITGKDFKAGVIRGWGLSAGFDYNDKNDAGYNSKKQMLVLGPTLMLDVPGFFNISLLLLWESNQPYNSYSGTGVDRYSYDPHLMLNGAWGLNFHWGALPVAYEGFFNFIEAKGDNEFGGDTAAETNIDSQLMFTLSGKGGNTFRLGLEYQYWKNKFGNLASIDGTKASTWMVRADYHF